MSTIAFDQFALTRIADFARSLSRLHQASRRRLVDDDAIDREFNAVCMSVWGYTTDDFSDELFSGADHAFLDTLDEAHARIFAAEQGYDLDDDQGMLTDWWGYCWMILAEKRALVTPENRAAARAEDAEKYLSAPNVIGVIVGRGMEALPPRALRHCEERSDEAIQSLSFRDGPKDQTRNLEIPGSMLRIAPE